MALWGKIKQENDLNFLKIENGEVKSVILSITHQQLKKLDAEKVTKMVRL